MHAFAGSAPSFHIPKSGIWNVILRLRDARVEVAAGSVERHDRDRLRGQADPGFAAGLEEKRRRVLGAAFDVDRADPGLDSFAEAGEGRDLAVEGVGEVSVG